MNVLKLYDTEKSFSVLTFECRQYFLFQYVDVVFSMYGFLMECLSLTSKLCVRESVSVCVCGGRETLWFHFHTVQLRLTCFLIILFHFSGKFRKSFRACCECCFSKWNSQNESGNYIRLNRNRIIPQLVRINIHTYLCFFFLLFFSPFLFLFYFGKWAISDY